MLSSLKKYYTSEQFNPNILGLLINPFYFARRGLYKNISELIRNLNGKILDIGCGHKPYERLAHSIKYIGLELDTPENRLNKKADYFYDGIYMPFKDNEFDSILSNQVFEHVFNPNSFLTEMNRVLRIEGNLLITVPFVWDEHEQPYDYARYSSFGLKHILYEHGFEIIEHRKSNNGIQAIFQLLNGYIYKVTMTKNGYLNLLITLVLIAPINITGLMFSKILPKNNDLYLDNIVLAKKVRNV